MNATRLPNYAPISALAPLLMLPGATFINLQYKDYKKDLTTIQNDFGIRVNHFDDLDQFNDIDDVAALTAALDFVVSTKLIAPMISAGVGTITKLANWRHSSWSNILHNPVGPSIDIFEKNSWESWDAVFHAIASDIAKL